MPRPGLWCASSPPGLYYMREELEDAIDHNIPIMKQILAEAKVSAETTANNASAAAKSEQNASASASRASESANKAAESQKNAEAARTAAHDDLQSVTEVKIGLTALKTQTEETCQKAVEECRGYAGAATYAFGPDENGVFSFFLNQ